MRVISLKINARIGNPLSPWQISRALTCCELRPDVFWSAGFLPSARRYVPSVVTVHDLIHMHFHSWAHRVYYNNVLRPLYRRCSAIICVSEYTRSEFIDWSHVDPGHVHVVYNGVSSRFHLATAHDRTGLRYIFYPGNKRKHKNLPMLLQAYCRSSLMREGIKLVMTGSPTSEIMSEVSGLKLSDRVVFVGLLSDEELPDWYRNAEFTVFISLYEGFGLPILESMAVGTPVLTSRVCAMPEVAGGAAYEVDPSDCDAIAAGMDTLLHDSDMRASLRSRGLERAKHFSWDVSATRTWDI
ncbi:MAG: glycosyltransferase family 4 protein, partial [Candidatus Micrarchaeaceae archaeon]